MKKIINITIFLSLLLILSSCELINKFIPQETFTVMIQNSHTLEVETQEVTKNNKITIPEYEIQGLILVGLKDKSNNEEFDYETLVNKDYELYTVFDTKDGYHQVTFETNSDTYIVPIIIGDSLILGKPLDPVKENKIFYGWYIDPEFNNVYDFNNSVTTDITLYAKYVDIIEQNYTINEDTLEWVKLDYASYYNVSINNEEPIFVLDNKINLSTYQNTLLDTSTLIVEAIFETELTYKLFEVKLRYDYTESLYETDFEGESFTTSTNYSNNTTPKIVGDENKLFHILNGAVSTTNPISGSKSIQLRNNTSTTNTPYIETQFTLSNVEMISFVAKSTNHHIKLIILDDKDVILEEKIFELSKDVTEYKHKINNHSLIKIRIELHKTSELTGGEQIFIDDLKIYDSLTPKSLVEVIKEENNEDLEKIKLAFEKDRNRLKPPAFNVLSIEGINAYYATLNGLTSSAFKLELQSILKNTHQRLISYDEARFILEESDLVTRNNKTHLDGIYSGHEIIRYWDGGKTWAREHVWPNSRLGIQRVSGSSKNQGSDVHNLRAINPSVNSSRSNRYFDQASTYGLVGTDAYYPGDEYKGDVARILFYMLVRYPDILTLKEDNILDSAYTVEGAQMGILSLLLSWHESDPVSEFETNRNEVIYTYQGNRNPFIDRPEYVDIYFNS
ncbi:endonuclease [Acholeplasma granularum]|uniref:endonuclease n=1 Tax=Acholeplasma granularum TaxID=264635 RepID=UPI0004701C52|nr:endonuclease [Acholeplasma granularum]